MFVQAIGTLLLVLGSGVFAKLFFLDPKHPLEGAPAPPGSPWPAPQILMTNAAQRVLIPGRFFILSNDAYSCDVIKSAIERYQRLMFLGAPDTPAKNRESSTLYGLSLSIQDTKECGYPKHEDLERYFLRIPRRGLAYMHAATIWGALRGLETFSQLVYWCNRKNDFVVNLTWIEDFPTYSYRGILLDTARHFLPVAVIKQNLDAMSYNKFNVFHWHIVDDQSWPLEMTVYPNLTESAYSPEHIYSKEDVNEIIEYARERGIRVIPEIDSPGHTHALGKVFPDILTPCYENGTRGTPNYPKHAAFENLDPTNPKTYQVMSNIFKEILHTFKDDYIHLGMDEAYHACWESSPEIKKFMKKKGFETTSQLEGYYAKKALSIVRRLKGKSIIWQEPITQDIKVPKDTLVQVWIGYYNDTWWPYAKKVASKGYKFVLSAPWYLNYISYGYDWKKYYKVDPRSFSESKQEQELVVGGEASMWGEYVDRTNLMPRLWPRASAVAERLWSSPSKNDIVEAEHRLDQHRCRMMRRGIPAQPIFNGFCGIEDIELDDKRDARIPIQRSDGVSGRHQVLFPVI